MPRRTSPEQNQNLVLILLVAPNVWPWPGEVSDRIGAILGSCPDGYGSATRRVAEDQNQIGTGSDLTHRTIAADGYARLPSRCLTDALKRFVT
jgi:hypothetical protein